MSKNVAGSVVGLVSLLATTAFLILGFIYNAWHPGWLVFLATPVTSIIVDIAAKRRNIAGAITGSVSLIATAAFLVMGFTWGLWHPGWIVFMAIPISGTIAKMFSRNSNDEQNKEQ